MRLNKILACCSLMAAALGANASVELTFEELGTGYNSLSSYKGATFVGAAYSIGAKPGGVGNFKGKTDATHLTNVVALTFDDDDTLQGDPGQLIINFDAGFSTFFQMLYTTIGTWEGTGVQVYSGANGTGTLLASSDAFASLSHPAPPACGTGIACTWGGINLDLGNKIAHSIVINAPDDVYFFDNLIFGDLPSGTGGTVPEPTGAALTLAALGALAITRRRRS